MSDIFDRYLAIVNAGMTQEEIQAANKAFNLSEGVGCKKCGGVIERYLVADEKGYYRRCQDCGAIEPVKKGDNSLQLFTNSVY